MIRLFKQLVLALAIALPATLQAQGAPPASALQPTSDWIQSKQDEYCRLSRAFSSGEAAIGFHLYSYGPQGSYRVTLVGDRLPRNTLRARQAMVSLTGREEAEMATVIISTSNNMGSATFRARAGRPGLNLSMVFMGGEDVHFGPGLTPDAERLYFYNSEMERGFELALGDMQDQLARLAECEQELLAGWGIDREQTASVVQPPELHNVHDVLRALQLPNSLIYESRSFLLQLRMTVDENGEVSGCVLQDPDWSERRVRALCRHFEGLAEFTPAQNASGEPVSSLYRVSHLVLVFD